MSVESSGEVVAMTIKAHFDGKVFVPDEHVEIPVGEEVTVTINAARPAGRTAGDLLAAIEANPELTAMWDEIAAGRDSVEVARDLRQRVQRRGDRT